MPLDDGSSPVRCVKKVSEKIMQRYVYFSLQKGHLSVIQFRNDRLIDSGLNVGYERHILTIGNIQ